MFHVEHFFFVLSSLFLFLKVFIMSKETNLQNVTAQTTQILQSAGHKTTETVIEQTHKYKDAYAPIYKVIDSFWDRLPYICVGIIVFIIFYFLSRLFKTFIRKALLNRSYTRQNLVLVLNRVGSTFILFFGFLVALVIIIPGFSPGQLISALGIGSVAIGFAFKDIFQNMLSGILILLSEPFRIGDDIIVNGMEGTVEDIQVRATFLRSFDGRRLVIPNATVYTSSITVSTAYPKRRCDFTVGIGYDDDIQTAQEIAREILNNNINVLSEPGYNYSVNVTSLGDFSVNLLVRWWIDQKSTSTTASISEVQTAIKNAFIEKGISIPYPIQDLNIKPVANLENEKAN